MSNTMLEAVYEPEDALQAELEIDHILATASAHLHDSWELRELIHAMQQGHYPDAQRSPVHPGDAERLYREMIALLQRTMDDLSGVREVTS